jgi:RNA polymerase sigma-70 factor (ECF subfamily)
MCELGKRLARGDQTAFAELYDACADRLHRYLVLRLRSREDASDVLQETFVRLARKRKRLRKVESPVAYAFAVARNEAARWTRRKGRRREYLGAEAGEAVFREAVDDEVTATDTADLVAAALDRLPLEHREILELKTFCGLTFRQISQVTGLPQGTAATHYRKAIQKLRGWLAKELS